MEYRTLGRSGCSVSTLALGTMTFGAESDEDCAYAQLDRFVEVGGTLIDTADVYSAGVLATKGRFPMGAAPNDVGLSRRHLDRALNASLRRLGVDCVDLYQVHSWDPLTPVEETLRFLDDAVRQGRIHYVGLSNFTGWQLQKAVDTADFRGLTRPVTLQPQYSLLAREIEWEITPACESEGLGLLPWSPLGGGWLTGKYRRDEAPTGATRLGENPDRGVEAYGRRGGVERTWAVVDEVRAVAEEHGASMAQVALAWLLARPAVTSVILGARTVEQLDDNLASVDLHLTDDQLARLDKVRDPAAADYPYGVPGVDQRSRDIRGRG